MVSEEMRRGEKTMYSCIASVCTTSCSVRHGRRFFIRPKFTNISLLPKRSASLDGMGLSRNIYVRRTFLSRDEACMKKRTNTPSFCKLQAELFEPQALALHEKVLVH